MPEKRTIHAAKKDVKEGKSPSTATGVCLGFGRDDSGLHRRFRTNGGGDVFGG